MQKFINDDSESSSSDNETEIDSDKKSQKKYKSDNKSILKDSFNLKQKSLFAIRDPAGVKLLSRLRLKFSHLNEHKFGHNFKDALSPICNCGSETETTDQFFLRCPFLK